MRKQLYIAYAPCYAHHLPEGHRFPMLKYELIPAQLLYEGTITKKHIVAPKPCADSIVLKTHTPEYVAKLKECRLSAVEERRIGFPQSPALTEREWIITQGTIDCCHYALENGVALNVAGGTHHAFADRGEGFCLLNDFAVAANYLLNHGLSKKILIVDLDVHQGNGTAHLFKEDNRVFTFSMHGRQTYPLHKEQSNLDVELEVGIDDAGYMGFLKSLLPQLMEKEQPDFVFYLSGVDVLATDKYGKMALSIDGCRARDRFVFETMNFFKTPCAVAMGGGYSPDVKTIVEAHCNTFRTAIDVYGFW